MNRPRLNLLVSYAHVNPGDLEKIAEIAPANMRLLIDSGAFTVQSKGITILPGDYADFLRSLPLPPWGYFTLDVIGDPRGTRRNYEWLREQEGLEPIPIVTFGSTRNDFRYYGRTAKLIALGGLQGAGQKADAWIGQCVQWMSKVAPGARAHLLGNTSANLIAHHRPLSVDSSSWDSAGRFGTMMLYAGGGKIIQLMRPGLEKAPQHIRDLIREHGVEPRDLLRDSAWRGRQGLNALASAAGYLRYAADVEERYDTRLFLAAVGNRAHLAVTAYERLYGKEE